MAADLHSKYLDYLQAAITRMAGHGFAMKGWSITVTTAVLGVASKAGDAHLCVIGLLPVLLFWGIDTYFLVLERRFRSLFKAAAKQAAGTGAATLDMSPGTVGWRDVARILPRPALLAVHGTLAASLLMGWVLLR
jgi:hypothetical protein